MGRLGGDNVTYAIEPDAAAPEAPTLPRSGFTSGASGPRLPLIDRAGLQLPGAIVAAIAPLFYYTWDPYASTSLLGMLDAYSGSLLSVTLGYYVVKQVTNFPTTHAAASVLPIFAGSFALVLGALAFLGWRFDYAPMFIGFLLSVAWLTAVLLLAQWVRRRQFALL